MHPKIWLLGWLLPNPPKSFVSSCICCWLLHQIFSIFCCLFSLCWFIGLWLIEVECLDKDDTVLLGDTTKPLVSTLLSSALHSSSKIGWPSFCWVNNQVFAAQCLANLGEDNSCSAGGWGWSGTWGCNCQGTNLCLKHHNESLEPSVGGSGTCHGCWASCSGYIVAASLSYRSFSVQHISWREIFLGDQIQNILAQDFTVIQGNRLQSNFFCAEDACYLSKGFNN